MLQAEMGSPLSDETPANAIHVARGIAALDMLVWMRVCVCVHARVRVKALWAICLSYDCVVSPGSMTWSCIRSRTAASFPSLYAVAKFALHLA
jgi:hypothetical protein